VKVSKFCGIVKTNQNEFKNNEMLEQALIDRPAASVLDCDRWAPVCVLSVLSVPSLTYA